METIAATQAETSVRVNIYMRARDGVQPFGIPPTGRYGEASHKQPKLSLGRLQLLPQSPPTVLAVFIQGSSGHSRQG